MKKLLHKEIKLCASPLSFIFISASLLSFVPGYPILLGSFFTCLGIFYSFQTTRENNDIFYSMLLPVSKADIVKSKFAFSLFVELVSFSVMLCAALIRMTLLKTAAAYVSNALMCANFVFLGFALLIFALFNFCFIRGFFKTAYYFGKPFVVFIVAATVVIVLAETLHHIPGLEKLNSFGFENLPLQLCFLATGAVLFVLLTLAAVKKSIKSFEKTDL